MPLDIYVPQHLVYGYGKRRKLSFSLAKCTEVFLAGLYALKACAAEKLCRNYRNRSICILANSQAAIKALDSYQFNSKLVLDCHQSLVQPAKHNINQLIWVPDHKGVGNETLE
jgi:quinolinate synthase